MNPLPDIVVILCTAPHAESEPIVRTLVNRRLVACVNVVPVQSCYHWKGEFCRDEEDLLIAKTTRARADEAISAIKGLHSYETPEIIVIPVVAGHLQYLEWVVAETQDKP